MSLFLMATSRMACVRPRCTGYGAGAGALGPVADTPQMAGIAQRDDRNPVLARLVDAQVDRLLADNRAYADHWMTFWNDHLRNAYFGPGFIDNGRALALADKFGLPIHAIGVGEQIDDLAPFDPEDFARALTGADR